MSNPFTPEERQDAFWSKVDRRGADDCWEWLASKDIHGYGKFGWGWPRLVGAHRVAFFYANGRWPDHACHTCDNKGCVNPAHIYDGNKSTNAKDFYARDPRAAWVRQNAGLLRAERNRAWVHEVKFCSVEGCDRRMLARGLCKKHYEQARGRRRGPDAFAGSPS